MGVSDTSTTGQTGVRTTTGDHHHHLDDDDDLFGIRTETTLTITPATTGYMASAPGEDAWAAFDAAPPGPAAATTNADDQWADFSGPGSAGVHDNDHHHHHQQQQQQQQQHPTTTTTTTMKATTTAATAASGVAPPPVDDFFGDFATTGTGTGTGMGMGMGMGMGTSVGSKTVPKMSVGGVGDKMMHLEAKRKPLKGTGVARGESQADPFADLLG